LYTLHRFGTLHCRLCHCRLFQPLDFFMGAKVKPPPNGILCTESISLLWFKFFSGRSGHSTLGLHCHSEKSPQLKKKYDKHYTQLQPLIQVRCVIMQKLLLQLPPILQSVYTQLTNPPKPTSRYKCPLTRLNQLSKFNISPVKHSH
jgi:hypothetical protein